jgi:hypothetical protein
MPKYLVVMQWFGEAEPELKVAEGESEEEVYERFEHNMNSITIVPLDRVLEAVKDTHDKLKVYLATFEIRIMESSITKQKIVVTENLDEATRKAKRYTDEMNEGSDWIIYKLSTVEEVNDIKDLLNKTITIH